MNTSIEARFIGAYDAYADAIFRFCYVQTSQRELALDLMQETFARVWRYLADGHRIDEMRPFLYRTARNALIDHSRRPVAQSLDGMIESGFDVHDERARDPLVSAQVAEAIRCIARLEDPYRDAVYLRFVEEMMPREIAHATGQSENAISVHITRGIQKLRDLMK